MNTNGKNTLGEVQTAQSRGTAAAMVGMTVLLFIAFLAGGLTALLIGQKPLVDMVAACIR